MVTDLIGPWPCAFDSVPKEMISHGASLPGGADAARSNREQLRLLSGELILGEDAAILEISQLSQLLDR